MSKLSKYWQLKIVFLYWIDGFTNWLRSPESQRIICFFAIHDWKYFSDGNDNGKFCKRCKKYSLDNIETSNV